MNKDYNQIDTKGALDLKQKGGNKMMPFRTSGKQLTTA
jgi:hypothetical protein